jgi:hypothetical protein
MHGTNGCGNRQFSLVVLIRDAPNADFGTGARLSRRLVLGLLCVPGRAVDSLGARLADWLRGRRCGSCALYPSEPVVDEIR